MIINRKTDDYLPFMRSIPSLRKLFLSYLRGRFYWNYVFWSLRPDPPPELSYGRRNNGIIVGADDLYRVANFFRQIMRVSEYCRPIRTVEMPQNVVFTDPPDEWQRRIFLLPPTSPPIVPSGRQRHDSSSLFGGSESPGLS